MAAIVAVEEKEVKVETDHALKHDAEREEEQLLTCPICHDELVCEDKVMVLTPCGHEYHRSCIVESLGHRNSCPLCARVFEATQLVQFFSLQDLTRAVARIRRQDVVRMAHEHKQVRETEREQMAADHKAEVEAHKAELAHKDKQLKRQKRQLLAEAKQQELVSMINGSVQEAEGVMALEKAQASEFRMYLATLREQMATLKSTMESSDIFLSKDVPKTVRASASAFYAALPGYLSELGRMSILSGAYKTQVSPLLIKLRVAVVAEDFPRCLAILTLLRRRTEEYKKCCDQVKLAGSAIQEGSKPFINYLTTELTRLDSNLLLSGILTGVGAGMLAAAAILVCSGWIPFVGIPLAILGVFGTALSAYAVGKTVREAKKCKEQLQEVFDLQNKYVSDLHVQLVLLDSDIENAVSALSAANDNILSKKLSPQRQEDEVDEEEEGEEDETKLNPSPFDQKVADVDLLSDDIKGDLEVVEGALIPVLGRTDKVRHLIATAVSS